jgi:hypothetical protein
LGRRHPHRHLAAQLQGQAGAAGAGRYRVADIRRAEREADDKLAFEMDRLHRSSPPDLAQPVAALQRLRGQGPGYQMMLPHVDEFRPVHNLTSMEGLIEALSAPPPPHHMSRIRSAA